MSTSYYYSDTESVIKNYDAPEPRQLRYYSFFTALSQVFGFLMLFFTGYWNGTYNGGYDWGRNDYDANGNLIHEVKGNWHYHSTFMTYGLVFLQGEAILMYRLFRHERKIFSKFLHGLFHLFTFIFFIFGLIAIVTHKNIRLNPQTHLPEPSKHMFSAHSWVGVSVMVAFVIQYIFGFVAFGFPKVSPTVRAWYLPVHRAVGLIIFVVSCAQALMGFMQETWLLNSAPYFRDCYSTLECTQGLVLNFNIVFLILFAITVVYLASSKKYIRVKTPDETERLDM